MKLVKQTIISGNLNFRQRRDSILGDLSPESRQVSRSSDLSWIIETES